MCFIGPVSEHSGKNNWLPTSEFLADSSTLAELKKMLSKKYKLIKNSFIGPLNEKDSYN